MGAAGESPRERYRMQRGQRLRERGFSQLEVIPVVMLVGIIAAIAIPRFPTPPQTGVVTSKLIQDISYAKGLSNRLQTKCGIYFIDSSSYRVFQDDDINNAAINPVTGEDHVVTLSGRFSGVTVGANFGTTLKFDAIGTPLDGSDIVLTAPPPINITVASGSETKTVRVEPNTGNVKIQ